MKKKALLAFIFAGLLFLTCIFNTPAWAQTVPTPTPPYEPCGGQGTSGCPVITPVPGVNFRYDCVDYNTWLQDKSQNFWVNDPEVTTLGKSGERARQFLYWTINFHSLDNAPSIINVWSMSRNISYFLIVLVAAVLGLGIIIGKKYNFTSKIEISPLVVKIILALIYATFSATIVLLIVQVSDGLMMFFIERLNVRQLFNIFFVHDPSNTVIQTSERAYQTFQGCSNLSTDAIESVKMSKFLVNLTNTTYYVIGIMFILRKVILWFLLIVSPFLAILLSFPLIRNTGFIWIGVFFQWLFYGPLFALFLGGLTTIWGDPAHIPFVMDFSRTHRPEGFIYPTAINILYGGPAQRLGVLNTSNYVDTFSEYVIALIMLWTVIVFPWWLLRIFRDYCCEGIYAMKNILMSMYDQRTSFKPPQPPILPSITSTIGSVLKIPKETEKPVTVSIRLENLAEIRKTKTEDVTRSLNLQASKLTDIANFETNRQTQETVKRNLDYLAHPTKAETPNDRQKFMNIRTELFNRAIKEDKIAKQILSSITTSKIEQIQKKEEIIKSIPQSESVVKMASNTTQLPQETIKSTTTSFFSSLSNNNTYISNVAQNTQTTAPQVQSILNTFVSNLSQPTTNVINSVVKQTGITKEKVTDVLKQTASFIKQIEVVDKTAVKEQVDHETVERIVENISQTFQTTQQPAQQPIIAQTLVKMANLPTNKVINILNSYATNVTGNEPIVSNIQSQTGLAKENIKNIVSNFFQNVNETPANAIDKVSVNTKTTKENVMKVIKTLCNNLTSARETVTTIAKQQQLPEKKVIDLIEQQIPAVSEPEINIEKTVPIPPGISIEDYEEVKKMWIKQYEKGEVPVTENIKTREEWVEQDIVFITNTLNKLLSEDEKLRQEGLDDLGYILPIFLINNLKGEELIVYLKAKIEAAKYVKEMSDKEKEITEKLKSKAEEELVDVEAAKKKEEAKTMDLQEEMPLQEEKPREEKNNNAGDTTGQNFN